MYRKCGYGVVVTYHLPKVLSRVRVSLAALFVFHIHKALRAYFFAYFYRQIISDQNHFKRERKILCIWKS